MEISPEISEFVGLETPPPPQQWTGPESGPGMTIYFYADRVAQIYRSLEQTLFAHAIKRCTVL